MPARRRIVVNGKFLSAEPTGVHRVAAELVRHAHRLLAEDAQAAAQLEMALWVPRDGRDGAERLGVPYEQVGPLRGIPWEQLTLPLKARGRTILSLCNVGPVLARDAVTMFHDAQVHITPQSYSPAFRTWYHLHQPLAGRRHRRILTVSGYSREQLALHGLAPRAKIGVIHNGVDHVLDIPADDGVIERLALEPRRYAVALANTQAHKNVGLLLRAFADPALRGLRLVLFGGAGRGAFEAAGWTVPDNVVFAGRIGDGELRALYTHALCIAFPSTTEGFGLPPLEAMLVGCPAIVAPCGALPEVCGAAALQAGPEDPAAWVAALRRLADDAPAREGLGRAAAAHAATFTWAKAARRLLDELLAL